MLFWFLHEKYFYYLLTKLKTTFFNKPFCNLDWARDWGMYERQSALCKQSMEKIHNLWQFLRPNWHFTCYSWHLVRVLHVFPLNLTKKVRIWLERGRERVKGLGIMKIICHANIIHKLESSHSGIFFQQLGDLRPSFCFGTRMVWNP